MECLHLVGLRFDSSQISDRFICREKLRFSSVCFFFFYYIILLQAQTYQGDSDTVDDII